MKDFESLGMSGEECISQQNGNGRPTIDGHIARVLKSINFPEVISKAFAELEDKLLGKLDEHQKAVARQNAPNHIWFKDNDIYQRIESTSILYLKADGNYTIFHLTDNSTRVTSKTMKIVEATLGYPFVRTDKSHIVNFDKVVRMKVGPKAHVVLEHETTIPVSKDRLASLKHEMLIQI